VRIRETEGEMGDRVLVSSLSTEEYITTAFMVRVAEGTSLLLCPSKIFFGKETKILFPCFVKSSVI
jgi:hypothetical protein